MEVPLPLKWLPPTDIDHTSDTVHHFDSILVTFHEDAPVYTGHGLLNINAGDFGIEFDRVAKMTVGPDATFCDGEIVRGQLLNRIVGLFKVEKVNAGLRLGEETFFGPDRLFRDGHDCSSDDLPEIIKKYLQRLGCQEQIVTILKEADIDAIRFILGVGISGLLVKRRVGAIMVDKASGCLKNLPTNVNCTPQ